MKYITSSPCHTTTCHQLNIFTQSSPPHFQTILPSFGCQFKWFCGRVFDDAVREIWYFRRASINIELSEKINSTEVIFYAHNNFSSQITVVAAYSCNPGIENSNINKGQYFIFSSDSFSGFFNPSLSLLVYYIANFLPHF